MDSVQISKMNRSLSRRLQKSLYYGFSNEDILEGCSLPLTEVTVDLIKKTISNDEECLGELDVNFASHILEKASISPASIMIAVLYLERLKLANIDLLDHVSPSELFLISLVVASKFLFDKGENEAVYNDEWAEFGHLELADLNRIEKDFLSAIDWTCYVDNDAFLQQLTKFEALISWKEYLKRSKSELTYTESICLYNYIKHLCKDDHLKNLMEIAQLVSILSIAYCVAVCVLVSSFSIGMQLHSLAFRNIEHLEWTSTYETNLNRSSFNYRSSHLYSDDLPESKQHNLAINSENSQQNVSKPNLNLMDVRMFVKPKFNKLLKCQ